ncbi:MAG: VIT and VWA domain-containing protein [Myxococcota bacterium]
MVKVLLLVFAVSLGWLLGGRTAEGQTLLEGRFPDGRPAPLRLIEEAVTVQIDGQHATSVIRQTHRNEANAQIEGRYRLRVGRGAQVEGFVYYNGTDKIVGEVFERELAREIYRDVTTARRDPGLLEQEGEGEFVFRIFPIAPGEDKRVEVRFSEWLPRQGNQVRYRVPVRRGDSRIRITVDSERELYDFESPTHDFEVVGPRGGPYLIRVGSAQGEPTAFELRYRIREAPFELAGYVHRDVGQDPYLLLTMPTADPVRSRRAPMSLTVILDRSASMAGLPLEEVQGAGRAILAALGPNDRLNFVAFNNSAEALFDTPRLLTPAVRGEAEAFIAQLEARGGTNLAGALTGAIADPSRRSGREETVILVTDGRSDGRAVLRLASDPDANVRMHTVGVGRGIDRALLESLARSFRGQFHYVQDAAVLEAVILGVFRRLGTPVLTDLELTFSGARAIGIYPRALGPLHAGEEFRAVMRIESGTTATAILSGRRDGRQFERRLAVTIPPQERNPWVARLWGQGRVEDLLEEVARDGESRERLDEIISLSIGYNIVTPYTAFLAIPEAELTPTAADLLAEGRAERQRILVRQQDATAVRLAGSAQQTIDVVPGVASGTPAPSPPTSLAPPMDASLEVEETHMERQVQAAPEPMEDSGDDEAEPAVAYAETAPGCGRCTPSPGESPGGWFGFVLIAIFALRRTRNTRR